MNLKRIGTHQGTAQIFLIFALGALITLIVALVLGRSVAEGDYFFIAILFTLVITISIGLGFRTHIWILMVVLWSIPGRFAFLPIPLSIREIGVLMAFGMLLIFYAMKVAPRPAKLNKYDGILFLNLLYLFIVYLRNPAGFLAFQTEIIGGRPYFAVLICLFAYIVMQHVSLSRPLAFIFPILNSIGGFIFALITAVANFVPGVGMVMSRVFTNAIIQGETVDQAGMFADRSEERQFWASGLGSGLLKMLFPYFHPLALLFFLKPVFSVLFYASLVAILFSGYRSGLAGWIVTITLVTFFRSGLKPTLGLLLAGLLALLSLYLVSQTQVRLPYSVQRSLAWLPGEWDPNAVRDGQSTAEWRFEMWRTALGTDRIIDNKWLGDGFGFTQEKIWEFAREIQYGQNQNTAAVQEYFMKIGAHHSGPISAIQYVGFVGLILFNILMFAMFFRSIRLLKKAKDTYLFPFALFVCIPLIYKPFEWWLIFGAYENDIGSAIFSLALLNLLDRGLAKETVQPLEFQNQHLSILGASKLQFGVPQPSASPSLRAHGR
jgi:hypothetical protein